MIKMQNILNDKYVSINDERYFFVKLDNKRHVIPDRCPHKGGPLSLGVVCKEKGIVKCPWHDNFFKLTALLKKSIPGLRIHDKLFHL